MAFMDKVRKMASSPEGRKVFREAQKVTKDPATRRKIDEARKRLTGSGTKGS